jgi:hypothetical protein
MATVNSEQSPENMEYVRRLLKQTQPGFSAALESAVDLVGRELESPTCCATSALPSLDPPTGRPTPLPIGSPCPGFAGTSVPRTTCNAAWATARRTGEAVRCLKRYIAREIFALLPGLARRPGT